MSIFSPRINMMIDTAYHASKQLLRDFNELQICNVKSVDFINKSYLHSKQKIHSLLYEYNKDYNFIFEDDLNQEIKDSNYSWFIMPIEGKDNFASCIEYFTISICLIHKNKVVAAIIYAPALKETFWAEENKGAFLEDSRFRCTKMRINNHERGVVDVSSNLLNKSSLKNIRSFGSITLGFAYLAAGRYSGVIYSGINTYEILLGKLFLQESGGKLIQDNELTIAGNIKLEQFAQGVL